VQKRTRFRLADLRFHAACALGNIGGPQALALLENEVMHQDINMRCAVAAGLGYIGGERALTLLEKLLADQDAAVRKSVAKALEDVGTEKACAILLAALKIEKDESVRSSIFGALEVPQFDGLPGVKEVVDKAPIHSLVIGVPIGPADDTPPEQLKPELTPSSQDNF
jgi:HEAT repeat protein